MIKKLEPQDITDQLVAEINEIDDDCYVVDLMKDFVADPDYFKLGGKYINNDMDKVIWFNNF